MPRLWTWPQWFTVVDYLEWQAAEQKKQSVRRGRPSHGGRSSGLQTVKYVDMVRNDWEKANAD